MHKLIFTQPEFGQKVLELPDGAFAVGRSQENQIIIEDASVSRAHAQLLVYGSEIIIRERGSRNGVFVRGVRIKTQSEVKHGEMIRFGRVEMLLQLRPRELEGSTEITAMQCFARHVTATSATGRPTQFPVRFIPGVRTQGITTVDSVLAASDNFAAILASAPEKIVPSRPHVAPTFRHGLERCDNLRRACRELDAPTKAYGKRWELIGCVMVLTLLAGAGGLWAWTLIEFCRLVVGFSVQPWD